ncbi:MAG TPA: DUF58 domain-containing protein [Candidatus Margulisiibacteriota bacterium]|nr:DUF58 domain-containing protein [Candidatus Margulisiibacteriota bacterium]
MLTSEQIKAIRKIQIRTSHLVSDLFAGQYQSVFKGRGMEFAEVRHYLPGDDIRTIDWNVTARTGVPHVKRFVEERELTVMLLVDASASTHFGTVKQLKSEMAAELAALFAFSAITNNDKVGLVMFSDQVELALPPKKGTRHVLRVIREVLSFTPQGRGTDIAAALEHLNHVSKRRCVTFVISDFLDSRARLALKIANRRHDVIAVVLDDPRDMTLPDVGLIELQDAESGERVIVDTGDSRVRREFEQRAATARRERDRMLRGVDIDAVVVRTDRPYTEALLRFFHMRERRH